MLLKPLGEEISTKMPEIDMEWEWLQNRSDRFTNKHTIDGKEEIIGFRREDALAEIEHLALDDVDVKSNSLKIGYWDSEDEKIWILSPLKMSLLLKEYDLAEKLFDKGYEVDEDFFADIDSCFYARNEVSDVYKCGEILYGGPLPFIFWDENIPDRLVKKLLLASDDISYNFDLEMRLNPKWLMKIADISDEVLKVIRKNFFPIDFFGGEFLSLCDRNFLFPEFFPSDIRLNKYRYKVRLQLQVDIAKKMIRDGQIEKLKRDIYGDGCVNSRFYEYMSGNLDYDNASEMIGVLVKQRRKLMEVCRNNKSLLNAVVKISLLEFNILQSTWGQMLIQNEDKQKKLIREIEKYGEMIKAYVLETWTNTQIVSVLKQSCANDFTYGTGDSLALLETITTWMEKRFRFKAGNRTISIILSIIPEGSVNEKDRMRLYKALNNIDWISGEEWFEKAGFEEKSRFISSLCQADDEELYLILHENHLLKGALCEEVVLKLLEQERYENVPCLIALKNQK